MKKMIFILLVLPVFAIAQPDVIAAGGGSGQTQSAKMTYTIGQTITATGNGNNAIITQGFQQPNYQITSTDENNFDLNVSITPNPTDGDLYIMFSNNSVINNNDKIDAEIINMNGQIIKKVPITSTRQKLDIRNYSSGVYFIKLHHNKKFKTYKVIKQ